jgi:nucleotide-binding universal stress UspA family protein
MTTHGWGGLKRLWLGSVADELVRRVRCPVLLHRPTEGQPAIGMHRVLIALEGVEAAEALLEPALEIGHLIPGTHYTLLHVVEPHIPLVLRLGGIPTRTGDAWVREIRDTAADRFEHLARRLRGRGIVADSRVLIGRGTGEQILNFARQAGCDLIVVGTRGARGADRAVFGSVADKVVRGATQMVLIVPLGRDPAPEPEAERHDAALTSTGGAP